MDYRTITAEEIDPFFASLATAFAEAHPDPDELASDRMVVEPERTFAAFDDGRIVGCAGVISQRMVVPGGALAPSAGITLVGVLPTHRRRGILRELMERMSAQAIDRGDVVTTLFASEAAIYGRFGFAVGREPSRLRRRAGSRAMGARHRTERPRDASIPRRGDAGHARDLRPGVPRAAGRARGGRSMDGGRLLGAVQGQAAVVLRRARGRRGDPRCVRLVSHEAQVAARAPERRDAREAARRGLSRGRVVAVAVPVRRGPRLAGQDRDPPGRRPVAVAARRAAIVAPRARRRPVPAPAARRERARGARLCGRRPRRARGDRPVPAGQRWDVRAGRRGRYARRVDAWTRPRM